MPCSADQDVKTLVVLALTVAAHGVEVNGLESFLTNRWPELQLELGY